MSDDLKPCPFCGRDGEWIDDDVVECIGCNIDVMASDWQRRPIEDALAAERDALRAEVERLRAEVAIWRRNFRRPDGPLDEVCEGACVYERRWIGCDRGCNPVWRTDAYLWARLTELYAEIDGPALNQTPAEVNHEPEKRQ